jgi:hypothetical protein
MKLVRKNLNTQLVEADVASRTSIAKLMKGWAYSTSDSRRFKIEVAQASRWALDARLILSTL